MAEAPRNKGPAMTLDELAALQPGLGRLMPEVGARTWKLFYAAKAGNWLMARFQAKEVRGLLKLCAFTRPKYDEDLATYLGAQWQSLEAAIAAEDFSAVEAAFTTAVDSANEYHGQYGKGFIRWRLPDHPPPDLDLTPPGRR